MSEREDVEAEVARDLTYAIMRFYGYTEADIAEAEAVHPGFVCDEEECCDEDGRSVHPSSYNELGGTASTVVEVVLPWLAAHVETVRVSERVRLAEEVEALRSALDRTEPGRRGSSSYGGRMNEQANGGHECVFVEEQEPNGRLILGPCSGGQRGSEAGCYS